MRLIALILLFCFLSPFTFAKSSKFKDRFDHVDQHVRQISQQMVYYPDILVDSLTKPFTNDFDKVRAIYGWIAYNIEYDLLAFLNNRKDAQGINDVLLSGKALCSGFSILFQDFCKRANIHSEVIEGYAKIHGYNEGDKLETSNHAWNAVNIYGTWYLLDVTWATGDAWPLFKKKRIDLDTHFLAEPESFVKDHLPEDPTWQLLLEKMSMYEFENSLPISGNHERINDYALADYENLDEHEFDILRYKRARLFNPLNIRFIEKLSFAYLYKGISIAEDFWQLDYNRIKDTVSFKSELFYAYMDSSMLTAQDNDELKLPGLKSIIQDEVNYQTGIFNYAIGAELCNKAYEGKIPYQRVAAHTEPYFEIAENHFNEVKATSIYFADAKEYLTLIAKLQEQIEVSN